MHNVWKRPEFWAVSVNGECTAYSGTSDEGELVSQHATSAERRLAMVAPADRLSIDEVTVSDGLAND
jgi:hypothetical protein